MQVEMPPRVPVNTDAGLLFFQPDDRVIMPAVRHTGRWEPEEGDLLEKLLTARPGWFIDLGAHVGYHSARLLHRNLTHGVVAVEANPGTHGLLEANLSRESYATEDHPVVLFHGIAWYENSHQALFQGSQGNGGDWRVSCERPTAPGAIPARRMDELVEPLRFSHEQVGRPFSVSVIKSDLQGRDHLALMGLKETIGKDRPDIVAEFDPAMIRETGQTPENILTLYREWGYVLRRVGGESLTAEQALRSASRALGRALTLWMVPTERAE